MIQIHYKLNVYITQTNYTFKYCKILIVSIPLNIAFLAFWLLALNIAYAKNTSK